MSFYRPMPNGGPTFPMFFLSRTKLRVLHSLGFAGDRLFAESAGLGFALGAKGRFRELWFLHRDELGTDRDVHSKVGRGNRRGNRGQTERSPILRQMEIGERPVCPRFFRCHAPKRSSGFGPDDRLFPARVICPQQADRGTPLQGREPSRKLSWRK
jgi:hypothetical protein